jgi:regulator of protease activity HflC (stomatin/prohibitin superfamily)
MGGLPLAILLLLLAGLVGFAVGRGRLPLRRRTVYEWERGLLYRAGRFAGALGPGRYWELPGRTLVKLPVAEQLMVLPAQEVLSADGFPVKLGATLRYRVAEPRTAQEAHAGAYHEPLRLALQLALRAAAVGRNLEALLAARSELDGELTAAVGAAARPMGIEVTVANLRDLALPAEVRRMVTEVERARRQGLAALERARGEQAGLRALANAARLLKNNPELQQLRLLGAIEGADGRGPPSVVLTMGAGAFSPPGHDAGASPEAGG